MGAESPFIGPEPFCGIGNHTLRKSLGEEEQHLRQLCCNDTQGLRQAKSLLGSYNLPRLKLLIVMGRTDLEY